MPPAIVIDRYGRRIEPDDGVVPDGGRVIVAMPFMDSRSAHVGRAFGDGLLHAPGWAQQALIGDTHLDGTRLVGVQIPAEGTTPPSPSSVLG